jgi:hypothetical protein
VRLVKSEPFVAMRYTHFDDPTDFAAYLSGGKERCARVRPAPNGIPSDDVAYAITSFVFLSARRPAPRRALRARLRRGVTRGAARRGAGAWRLSRGSALRPTRWWRAKRSRRALPRSAEAPPRPSRPAALRPLCKVLAAARVCKAAVTARL